MADLPGTPEALQFKVLPEGPVLAMVKIWPAGVAPPDAPLKVMEVGLREMEGKPLTVTVLLTVGELPTALVQ